MYTCPHMFQNQRGSRQGSSHSTHALCRDFIPMTCHTILQASGREGAYASHSQPPSQFVFSQRYFLVYRPLSTAPGLGGGRVPSLGTTVGLARSPLGEYPHVLDPDLMPTFPSVYVNKAVVTQVCPLSHLPTPCVSCVGGAVVGRCSRLAATCI
jgi:hypothetical protein